MTHGFIDSLASIIIMLPAFLIGLTFHEFAHALTATLLGDDTPRIMGRLTLNPIVHIDPLGFLFLILFRFGWAKPVTFNQKNFKHPRFYSILTAIAGPFSNFLLALFFLYCIAYLPITLLPHAIAISLLQILQAAAYINIMLGVFNLLPIPPLDGGHILTAFLVNKFPKVVFWLYQYSLLVLIGLFFLPQTRMLLTYLMFIAEKTLRMLVF